MVLVSFMLFTACEPFNMNSYHLKKGLSLAAQPVTFSSNFENVTQESMMGTYTKAYGWTDLKSHELFWNGNIILIRYYFEKDAERWQLEATREYTYTEMKLGHINDYRPTPYQIWITNGVLDKAPKVCAEIYIDNSLLLQDIYDGEGLTIYENTNIEIESRNIHSEWTDQLTEFIDKNLEIDNMIYQDSILGKAAVVQIHSSSSINGESIDEIKDYIKNELAYKAFKDEEESIKNLRYEYIVLEVYKSGEKYYEDVFINRDERDWRQFDWMND